MGYNQRVGQLSTTMKLKDCVNGTIATADTCVKFPTSILVSFI